MRSSGEKIHWSESRTFWIVAAIVIIAVYFFGLTIPLIGPDEPRYAQVAREMFERGDWVTPSLGGYHWFEKPALLYWLQIISYYLFGVNEFAARFGSALFGLGTVVSLWVLGRFFNADEQKRRALNFANLLGLIAASSIGIIVFSRGASFDIILTFPVTAAMVSFYFFYLTQRSKATKKQSKEIDPRQNVSSSPRFHVSISLFAFYFFIGVALLAKGLVGIIFPFAIVGFYYLLCWQFPSRTFIYSIFWGTIVTVTVASLWYVPMCVTHGWPFVNEFFIQHHFQRYTSNKYFHPQPFYFFLWVLPLMTIPWLPFFLTGVWSSVRKLFNSIDSETRSEKQRKNPVVTAPDSDKSLLIFSATWLLVPLVFFSFSGSKLPGYILPSLPPALIVTAIYVAKFVGNSWKRRVLIIGLAAATFSTIVILLLSVIPKFADDDSVKRLIATADERGFTGAEVLSLHTISHNAEFYAAERLLRSSDGKQVKLYGVSEVLNEIRKRNGDVVLVIVPNEYAKDTLENPLLEAELIALNEELSIIAAHDKSSQP